MCFLKVISKNFQMVSEKKQKTALDQPAKPIEQDNSLMIAYMFGFTSASQGL